MAASSARVKPHLSRAGRGPLRASASLALCVALLAGCQEERRPARPEDVVRQFIQVMQSVHGDPARGAEAVSLLWEPARKNLLERASRATAAIGSEVKPGDMLAPSWFSLQMTPRSFETRLDGTWAEVTVRGLRREDVYSVRCVQENKAWRIALELPPLPPIQKRYGGVQADD